LQFLLSHFPYDFHVFRHKNERKVVVLAGENMRFRGDGQFEGTNDIFDPQSGWESEYRIGNAYIHGNPISVYGHALPARIKLKKSEWQQILSNGSSALDVHIPAAGPMDYSECGKAFREAPVFFSKYFPDHKINAFTCNSWFLDHQFESYLPESSNIVRFLKEVYLIPLPEANDSGTFFRIFGQKRIDDLAGVPQDTSLQRAVIEHIKAGMHWHSGGCLLFPDDLNWGSQAYRVNMTI
ncbi:MAG: hypothetical protein PHV82_13620, partial [Victivallaceae bacterium]|nr:hypothetical protein [Victivallaceae bacterium]